MILSDPITHPTAWDIFYVAGIPCPGIVDRSRPIRAESPFIWDEKKGPFAGANVTFRGKRLARFVVTLLMWRNGPPMWQTDDWSVWNVWIPFLEYDSSKNTPTPVNVSYPSLADRKIRSAVCENIISPYWSAPGMHKAELHMLGFLPSKPVPAVTPKSAITGGSPNSAGAAPQTSADVQALQAQIAAEQAKHP